MMDGGLRRALVAQLLLTAVVAMVAALQGGIAAAGAAFYGGAIAMANTLLLARRVRRAGDAALQGTNMGMVSLYLGVVERFAVAIAGFAFGIGVLRLPVLPQLAAFVLAQFGFIAAARDNVMVARRRRRD